MVQFKELPGSRWAIDPDSKVVCTARDPTGRRCTWRGKWGELDRVQDPKGSRKWCVCPQCRTPEHIEDACSKPPCWRIARYEYRTPDATIEVCGRCFNELEERYGPSWTEDEQLSAAGIAQAKPERPKLQLVEKPPGAPTDP
jgi:hypothetical protein